MITEEMVDARSSQHERIVEILVFILGEMRKHHEIADIDLNQLAQRGFSQTEISTAFSWLFDRMAIATMEGMPASVEVPRHARFPVRAETQSIRIYHEVERMVLSREAQGYLLQLRELGLLTDFEVEAVIDRVMMSGLAPVGADIVKELVASIIFDSDESGRLMGRQMLDSQDTIQ